MYLKVHNSISSIFFAQPNDYVMHCDEGQKSGGRSGSLNYQHLLASEISLVGIRSRIILAYNLSSGSVAVQSSWLRLLVIDPQVTLLLTWNLIVTVELSELSLLFIYLLFIIHLLFIDIFLKYLIAMIQAVPYKKTQSSDPLFSNSTELLYKISVNSSVGDSDHFSKPWRIKSLVTNNTVQSCIISLCLFKSISRFLVL